MTTQNDDMKKKKKKKKKNASQPSPCTSEAAGMSRWGEHENKHHEFYMTMELHNVTMGGA
jgi:hypothetical protein